MSFEDTVKYLERRIAGFDIVVSCQNVADIYPALERMLHRPPLIEHGGLVSEALAGPKQLTTRYVGVCDSIGAAAADRTHSCQTMKPHCISFPWHQDYLRGCCFWETATTCPIFWSRWTSASGCRAAKACAEVEGWHQAQFQAFELLMGRMWTQIGGHPDFLDIVGVN